MSAAASLPLLQGGLMMAGLIVAIGALNANVLRQGPLCALSDGVLTVLGVFGLGGLVAPSLATQLRRWFGAAFLAWYAIHAAQRARHGNHALAAQGSTGGLQGTLATAAAVTWLNPHVCLDTVVLPGAAAAGHDLAGKQAFAPGAGLASLMRFSTLGCGAAALSRWLARPAVWRAVDALIALVMAATAINLLRSS
jgi:L-lysine exporter family protein LysE/ArgO